VAWELAVLALVLFVPSLRNAFGVVSLAPGEWVMVVTAACSVLPVLELGKAWIRRRWPET
jgi:Ca2+-transporting ATPase